MTREADSLAALRQALDDYAEADAEALVGEARAEARAKVRTALVEAMTERLLERAHAQLSDATQCVARGSAEQRGADSAQQQAPSARKRPASARTRTLARGGPGRAPSTKSSESRARRTRSSSSRARKKSPSSAAPSASDRSAEAPADGLYVYGVVYGDAEIPNADGIDGEHPLVTVREGELAAVASAVSLEEFGEAALEQHFEDLEWLERNARTHEYVLDSMREHATLVPMRMCTIYRTEASVREMLAREHDFLADALARLAGRTEWGVKIFLHRGHHLRPRGDSEADGEFADEIGQAGPGEGYLLRRQRAHQREEEASQAIQECAEHVHEQLSAASVEARLNPLQPPELTNREEQMALNGVYLVEDAEGETFNAAVEELQGEYGPRGAELELTGPWPPYNFVNSSSEVGR